MTGGHDGCRDALTGGHDPDHAPRLSRRPCAHDRDRAHAGMSQIMPRSRPAIRRRSPGMRGQHAGSFETAHAHARAGRRVSCRRDCRPRSATTWSSSAPASAGLPRPCSIAAPPGRPRASSSSTTTMTSAATPRETSSRSMAACVIGYGGSEFDGFSRARNTARRQGSAARARREVARFETAFERTLYSSLGLSRGVFFAREAFGRDVLVAGEPPAAGRRRAHAPPRQRQAAGRVRCRVSDLRSEQGAVASRSTRAERDPLAGKIRRGEARAPQAPPATATTSSASAAAARRWRTASRAARWDSSGSAATPCRPRRRATLGYPGFQGLGLPPPAERRRASPTSTISPTATPRSPACWCARSYPKSRAASTMDDVVLAPFAYGKLDSDTRRVRIRLDSTCLDVRNAGDRVQVGYVRAGMPHRVAARHAVLACFHCVIPYIMPELPASQRDALAHEHQDADRLHQCAHTQLARRGCGWACTISRRRCRSTAASSSIFP